MFLVSRQIQGFVGVVYLLWVRFSRHDLTRTEIPTETPSEYLCRPRAVKAGWYGASHVMTSPNSIDSHKLKECTKFG